MDKIVCENCGAEWGCTEAESKENISDCNCDVCDDKSLVIMPVSKEEQEADEAESECKALDATLERVRARAAWNPEWGDYPCEISGGDDE
jgi:hypothetical protein